MRISSPHWLSAGLFLGTTTLLGVVGLSCLGSSAVQPLGPRGPSVLSWNEPLAIQWNQAIDTFSVQVSPDVQVQSSVGPDGRVGYVLLEPEQGATEYQVTVTDAVTSTGAHLLQ